MSTPAPGDDLAAALEQWRMAAAQATPGPWHIDEKHGRDIADEGWSEVRIKDAEGDDVAATFISHLLEPGNSVQDEVFIVAARTAMPRFLAAVEAALKLADEMKQEAAAARKRAKGHVDRGDGHAAAFAEGTAEALKGCARAFRETINRELTGKEAGGA